jgi:hypothetical protein
MKEINNKKSLPRAKQPKQGILYTAPLRLFIFKYLILGQGKRDCIVT